MTLLYYCAASVGGIADYAHEQAKVLAAEGAEVTVLCPQDFPHEAEGYVQRRELLPHRKAGSRWRSRLQVVQGIAWNLHLLYGAVKGGAFPQVLLATYSEYLAPLWAWRFRALRRKGVTFSAVVHDPVRDYVVGPKKWHEWSVREGYSFLSRGFVHHEIELPIPTTVIPHGPFGFPEATKSRAELGLPEGERVYFSFGHLRDNKNLNLVLEALAGEEEGHLLVAGSEAPPGQVQSGDYQSLADSLGIGDRCHWRIGHVPEKEAADYFGACDVVVLTYAESFRSASGVLNVAAQFGKTVMASGGDGPLKEAMARYQLGNWCEPNSVEAIGMAMKKLQPAEDWERYRVENSWQEGARKIMTSFK
ncbi:MAG: glycosyltransferase [Verrucomicrobiaceae bacterium]